VPCSRLIHIPGQPLVRVIGALAVETRADDRQAPGMVIVVSERTTGSHHELTDRLGEFAGVLRTEASRDPSWIPDAEQLVRLAAGIFEAARFVSLVTVGDNGSWRTLSSTDDVARELDELQFRLGEGPCVDLITAADVVRIQDLERDGRWPDLAAGAVAAGARSLLAARTPLGSGRAVTLLWGDRPGAFTPTDADAAVVLAALVGASCESAFQRSRADNLEVALESSRQIGIAIGILMTRELITADQAFDRLRAESQRRHRKLREVADEVARSGELPRPAD
jgi:hypothetical protein